MTLYGFARMALARVAESLLFSLSSRIQSKLIFRLIDGKRGSAVEWRKKLFEMNRETQGGNCVVKQDAWNAWRAELLGEVLNPLVT